MQAPFPAKSFFFPKNGGGAMGAPGSAGLLVEGVRVQTHGIGSPPSRVVRVLTHYTHVRVLPARATRFKKNPKDQQE